MSGRARKKQSLRRSGGLKNLNKSFDFAQDYPAGSDARKTALLLGAGFLVLAAEALNAAGGVHQLLFACEKRVAIRTDFQADVAFVRGSGIKRVAACAMHMYFFVSWMNRCLHDLLDLSVG
jgi:hypothetical protein